MSGQRKIDNSISQTIKQLREFQSKMTGQNGDRHKIWKRVRYVRGRKTITIKEGSEEWIRLQTVLDILLEADLKYLHELMEKKHGKKKTADL